MKRKEYNGWTNYETWVTKLWMDNNQESYNYYQELAEEYRKQPYELSQRIKEEFEEANPLNELESSVFHDLLNSAISNINWYEIAESLLEE